jgi:hypothetical protein
MTFWPFLAEVFEWWFLTLAFFIAAVLMLITWTPSYAYPPKRKKKPPDKLLLLLLYDTQFPREPIHSTQDFRLLRLPVTLRWSNTSRYLLLCNRFAAYGTTSRHQRRYFLPSACFLRVALGYLNSSWHCTSKGASPESTSGTYHVFHDIYQDEGTPDRQSVLPDAGNDSSNLPEHHQQEVRSSTPEHRFARPKQIIIMETTDVPASAPPVARTSINILRPYERLIRLSYSFIRLGTSSRSTNPIDSHLSFDFQHLILVLGNSLDSRRGSVGFLKITQHISIHEFLTNHLIQEYFWRWTSLPLSIYQLQHGHISKYCKQSPKMTSLYVPVDNSDAISPSLKA